MVCRPVAVFIMHLPEYEITVLKKILDEKVNYLSASCLQLIKLTLNPAVRHQI